MRQLLIAILLVFVGVQLNAQNLSFTCPRDTTLGCNVNCLTIQGVIPNLRGAGSDYTFNSVNNLSGCRTYDPPQTPGPSANITADDRYSDVITLPFSFPFYGTYYNKVVACGNGYLSFDTSLATAFAAWDLSPNGTPLDFPSDLYDRALITSPFHDLDPSSTASSSRQIKYQTIGFAPNRVWVLSYFRVPLYGTGCATQIENTHQIALHESTGMIEVFIQDKQICASWNDGRAMVGLQDWTRTKAIMPPGRRATDLPWGDVGMNEVWRFYPRQGAPLFKKVELLNDAGVVLQTNTDTSRINSDLFSVSFPNVCPSSPSSMYVIRTTYAQISNPNATIFNLDTIYITQITSIPVTATPSATSCGSSNGSITVSANYGIPPFQYSLNGSAPQSSNVFNGLRSGIYTVNVTDSVNCTGSITIFVDSSNQLSVNSSIQTPTCNNRNDGKITLTPNGGNAPFTYTLVSGPVSQPAITQAGEYTFSNLMTGNYAFRVDDASGCTRNLTNQYVDSGTFIFGQTSITSICSNQANGTITVTPTSGVPPYQFSMQGYNGPTVPAGLQGTFSQLAAGTYAIVVTDSNNCTGGFSNLVVTSIPSLNGGASSVAASCPQARDGRINVFASGGSGSYVFTLLNQNNSVIATSTNTTFNGIAPGNYRVTIADSLGCSLDSIIFVWVDAGIAIGYDTTVTACSAFVWNGSVFTSSGTYSFDTVNAFGCAVTDTLRLTINQGTFRSETQTACDRFIWNNQTYTNSGMYIYQYTNGQGCPSYDTLFLTINQSTSSTETVEACTSYNWRGNTYTTSGTFIDAGTNSSGCTRLDTLILTINTGTFNAISIDTCTSYTWNGTTYTTSGTYLRNYNNTNGCASTDTLKLTIRNNTTSIVTEVACDSIVWNGNVYTTSGTYTFTTINAQNCDSTVTLNLTINQNCNTNLTARILGNPTNNDYFRIQASSPDDQTPVIVRLLDQSGRLLTRITMTPNSTRDLQAAMGPGVYMIELTQGENRVLIRGLRL
jgi:hypothetical protein